MKLSECSLGLVVTNKAGKVGRILLGLRQVVGAEIEVEVHWVGSERSSYSLVSELTIYEQ